MSDVNIFEEDVWPIKVRRSSGKGPMKTKDVKIKIQYPDSVKTEELKLDEDGAGEVDHTTAKVADDKANYRLTATAEFKNRLIANTKKNLEEQCVVWPKKAIVTVVDDKGGKVPKFKFRPKQGKIEHIQHITDDDGKAEILLKKNDGKIVIQAEGPFQLLEQKPTPNKPREIKVKVKRLFQVKFVSMTKYKGTFPPTDGKPLTAFVNLNPAKLPSEQTEIWGKEVEIEVAAFDLDGYVGKAGDEIFIQVEFGRESKRNSPLPELKNAGTVEKAENTEGTADAKQIGKVTLADNGAGKFTAKFKILLGLAGGDTCSVKLANAKDAFDGSNVPEVKFVNWRRVYYQLSVGSGATAPVMDNAIEALKNSFIEFVKYKDFALDATIGATGAVNWFPAGWLDSTANKYLNVGNYNKAKFHEKFVDTYDPVGVHIACAHTQYDAYTGAKGKTTVTISNVDATKKFNGKHAGSVWVGKHLFPNCLLDNSDAFVSGSWTGDDGTTTDNLVKADVKCLTGTNHGWLIVWLPAAAESYVKSDPAKKVNITVTVKVANGPYNGEAAGHLQLIALKRDDGDVGINKTIVHELGHSCFQCVNAAAPGLAKTDHGRWYDTSVSHTGEHCADGMSDDNYGDGTGKAGSDYKNNFNGKPECICVMYGEGSATRKNTFCTRCQPFILAQDLTKLKGKP